MHEMPPIPDFPPKPWWWLSFADPDKPEGQRFAGVCIVQGSNMEDAVSEAWRRKCNPGGEIMALALGYLTEEKVPLECRNRLMSGEEVRARGF